MNTLSVSIHDENNLGDRVCNPCDYFDELKDVRRWNAWDSDWKYSPSNLIFGGGGLIHGELEHHIRMVTRRPDRKLIAWGLGHNRDGSAIIDYKDTLDGFDLVGVRDYKVAQERGWDYVPCASCMSPEFEMVLERHKKPYQSYVVYAHVNHPVILRKPFFSFLTLTNDVPDLATTLNFLACAEHVITNSFHGAYWAMLLGRNVSIFKPFSSRFHDFKYQPPFCDENNWKDVEPLAAPAGYLEECRDLNRKFYEKVKSTLGFHADRTTRVPVYSTDECFAILASRNAGDRASKDADPAQLPLAQSEARSVPERPLVGGEHDARGDQQIKELNAGTGVIP